MNEMKIGIARMNPFTLRPSPQREERPAVLRLLEDDAAEIEIPVDHHERDDGEPEGDLVGNHLAGRAHAAEKGYFEFEAQPASTMP